MEQTQQNWYCTPTAGHEVHGQSVIVDEAGGKSIALVYDGDAHGNLLASAPALLAALEKMGGYVNATLAGIPLPSWAKADELAARAAISAAKGGGA